MFHLLLFIFFCLFFCLAYRNLVMGLCLIAVFLPSYLIRFQILGVPFTLLEGMILIAVIVWFIKHWGDWSGTIKNFVKGKMPSAPFNQWFLVTILFLLAATFSVFISANLTAALGIWKAYFVEPILLFSVFISTVKNKEQVNKIILSLVLGGLIVAIFAVIQKFTGWLIPNPFWQAEATRRVTSFFGYPNAVALYLAPLIPLVVYLFEKRDKNHRASIFPEFFYFFIFCFFVAAIIFARSSGALVALVMTLLIFGVLNHKTRWAVLFLTILFGSLIFFTPLKDPFSQEVLLQGTAGQVRVNMWGETIQMLSDHPIIGAGLSNYQAGIAPYHILKWAEIYLYPHNLFLNFWSEIGLIGLILFFWLVILFFREGLERLRDQNRGSHLLTEVLLASMLIILIHGLVDVPYFKNDLSVFFWLLMGFMAVNNLSSICLNPTAIKK